MRTACQDACDKEGHSAIVFGDLKDPNSEISQILVSQTSVQIRADLELNTGVRYLNL
jgi:molybdopterin-containing oxidoreductase family iron-sulfur binding subunit